MFISSILINQLISENVKVRGHAHYFMTYFDITDSVVFFVLHSITFLYIYRNIMLRKNVQRF